MARGGRQYEMVLETRHLLGVFFAAVILCAVFFTLGFVMGRNQERAAARAAELKARTAEKPQAPASPPDIGFYDRLESRRPPAVESKPAEAAPSRRAAPAAGSILLQVAAVTRKDDAERLSKELLRLGFPSLIVAPTTDSFYRVQVGPFSDPELAAAAQRRLEAQGFKVFVRR